MGQGGASKVPSDAPVYISTRQDVTIRQVTIASNLPHAGQPGIPAGIPAPLMYFELGLAEDAGGEWCESSFSNP